MAILRSEIRNKYTSIPNTIIQCKDLSDGDFRLLIYLYSLPDKWKINQGYLGQEMGCSRVNINKKIKRIKEAGYLEIIKGAKETDTDFIYILKEKGVSVADVSLADVSLADVSVSDTYINTYNINTYNINTKYKYIVEYLNKKTGKHFKINSAKTKALIKARLNEGYTEEDFIKVIDIKTNEWLKTKMEQYLRPETLFSNKFEGYLNQSNVSPSWFDKDIKKEEVSDEELEELQEMMRGYEQ